jgi:3-oxoacyl-[acyl-carrier protein] reductase
MPRLSTLSRSISDKVAVVTGGASGMGRATAHLFADEGARVAVADRNGDGARAVADEITAGGGVASGWDLDVSDADAILAFVEAVAAMYGGVDILINNAGVSVPAPIDADNWEQAWAFTVAVNLTGEARLVRACLPHLLRSGAGRVVNIASTEGLGASAYMTPYTASKHGVVGLTRALAVELGSRGVTVNCICPGPIRTGMTAPIPDEAKDRFARRRVPLRRYGEPEEVAQITLSLVLPAASYLNGAVIPVDGGMLAQNHLNPAR